ncbi:pyridoxamine 5'-phosphate oxidase [Thiomicrorhabdus cannonii]|uniref:pyridoxamine 5'-phosphate oxidase n=1 Tax=Thiomicrorhabdus cannonii TaxID=2748011 RepID=UPI0015B96367|nr:pyridoxamine 5'-phosphate oxidase [Thiomicrorhabdus cannonii]
MPNRDYRQERRSYEFAELKRSQLKDSPFEQFSLWMDAAITHIHNDPTAMSLSTVDANGQPHSRVVLLKEFDTRGLVFYTHYDSDKGSEMAANHRVAALFFWPEMERQIRVEGLVEKITAEESETYFHSRPRDSQLAAFISKQSSPVSSRDELELRLQAAQAAYSEQEVPHPPHWGGYRIVPQRFEFWQGRPSRLHDRFRYEKQDEHNWLISRLAP